MASKWGRDKAPPPQADNPDASPYAVARTIALRSLERAPRTRKQLADLLAKRLVPDEVAAEVLDRLEEVNLIDDRDYAMRWVAERHRFRGLSKRVLRQELMQKGVDSEYISEALEQLSADDEFSAALDLAQRRIIRLRDMDPVTQKRRLGSFLQRKGYSYSVVSVVVDDVMAQTQAK